jgi:hypothetical protein
MAKIPTYTGTDSAVQGPLKFRTREKAVEACMEEINNGIKRTQRRLRGIV